MIRLQDEPGGVKDSASFLVERAEPAGRLLQRKPVADREAEPELVDGLASLLLGIRGGRNHRNLLPHQLVLRSIERSQLLLTLRSPVGPLHQTDPPTPPHPFRPRKLSLP